MLIVRHPDALPATAGATALLACRCRPAMAGPGPGDPRPSLHWMRRATEEHRLPQRRLRLDEDAWLPLNGRSGGASTYRGDEGGRAYAVYFGPALLQAVGAAPASPFTETLHPHGDAVSERLRLLERHLDDGAPDPRWCEQQVAALLADALARERALREAAQRIDCVKAGTRQALLRRVLLASDFILSHHDQPITLDEIAGAARLSRFHLLRLFRQVHGTTPHAFLQAKRLQVAERLLERPGLDLADIAERSGFGTRWSLFRQLRKRRGAGGDALRHRHDGPPCLISA